LSGVQTPRWLLGYGRASLDRLLPLPTGPRRRCTVAELLFEVFSQCYERGATIVTFNLLVDEWTSVFASERPTGVPLDRLTHHPHSADEWRQLPARAEQAPIYCFPAGRNLDCLPRR
jgi:hypothetical protein